MLLRIVKSQCPLLMILTHITKTARLIVLHHNLIWELCSKIRHKAEWGMSNQKIRKVRCIQASEARHACPWIAAKVSILREQLFRQNEVTPVWNAESQDPTDSRICTWTFLWLTGTGLEKHSFKVCICVTFQSSWGSNSNMATGTAWIKQISWNTTAGWAKANLRTGK